MRLPKCEWGFWGVYILHEDLGAFSAISHFICICTFTSIPSRGEFPGFRFTHQPRTGLIITRKNSRDDELNPTPLRLVRNLGLLEQDMSRHHTGVIQIITKNVSSKVFIVYSIADDGLEELQDAPTKRETVQYTKTKIQIKSTAFRYYCRCSTRFMDIDGHVT